jgi:hypothetical protein
MLDRDESARVYGLNRTDGREAIQMIDEERRRHVAKGFSSDHDDGLDKGQLGHLAACYAAGSTDVTVLTKHETSALWPSAWESQLLTAPTRLRQLVIAGALIVAEIERLQRARPAELVGDHQSSLTEIQI